MKNKQFKKRFAKKRWSLLVFSTLSLLLLCGCNTQQPEEEMIVSDYADGIFKPKDHHYILTLPSADWAIEGEENASDIVFTYKNNAIQVQTFTDNLDELIEDLPKEQSELEEELKMEGYVDCQVEDFKSTVSYENEVLSGEISYLCTDFKSGNYVIGRDIYFDDEVFILTASADSNNYVDVQSALQQFEILDENKTTDVSNVSETKDKNVYTSYDGAYTLLLPYDDWIFSVDEEIKNTIISCENKTLTVSEINSQEQNNTIEYEVPRTLFSLDKQIENLNLGAYEILLFQEETIGAVSDIEQRGYYCVFSYLLELKEQPDGVRYYSYYEYRNEDVTYKIIGKTNSPFHDDSEKLFDICNSFSLK